MNKRCDAPFGLHCNRERQEESDLFQRRQINVSVREGGRENERKEEEERKKERRMKSVMSLSQRE